MNDSCDGCGRYFKRENKTPPNISGGILFLFSITRVLRVIASYNAYFLGKSI